MSKRTERTALGAFFLFMIVVQAALAYFLRFEPTFDVAAVFNGAKGLSAGALSEESVNYFAMFSNNFGLMVFMSAVFKVVRFITFNRLDYFFIYAGTIIVLVNTGVWFLYDTIKRTLNIRAAMISLGFLLLYIPIYLFPSMIYTDTMSIAFPIIALNLFLRLQKAETGKQKIVLALLLGLSVALGAWFKATVGIILIAIFMTAWIANRKSIYKFLSLSLAVVVLFFACNSLLYNAKISDEAVYERKFPVTYWLSLALNRPDAYEIRDFDLIYEAPNQDAKKEVASGLIREKLSKMDFGDFLALIPLKLAHVYSKPDLQPGGIIPYGSIDTKTAAVLSDMRFNGTYYRVYNALFFYGTIILALLSIFVKKRNITAFLAWVGLNAFLVMWEVNPKYATNFLFIMIFLAAITADALIAKLVRKKAAVGAGNAAQP